MKNKIQDSWQPESSWGGLTMAVASKLKEAALDSLKKADLEFLSLSRVGVLNLLSAEDHTQSELCEKLKLKAPTVLDFLKRLEKRGLIQVKPHLEDARKKQWGLTKKGKKVHVQAKRLLRQQGRRIDDFFKNYRLSQAKLEEYKSLLKAFLEAKI